MYLYSKQIFSIYKITNSQWRRVQEARDFSASSQCNYIYCCFLTKLHLGKYCTFLLHYILHFKALETLRIQIIKQSCVASCFMFICIKGAAGLVELE